MIMTKKQAVTAVIFSGILALLPGCWPFGKKEMKQQKQTLYVINVLDKESYEDCNIAGSINVPFQDVESFAKDLDRATEMVVYCANYMCAASGSAAQKLKEMGFEKVWAYEGGSAEWYQLGSKEQDKYPVHGSCKASYLTAANQKPEHTEADVLIISAQALREKMLAGGLINRARLKFRLKKAHNKWRHSQVVRHGSAKP